VGPLVAVAIIVACGGVVVIMRDEVAEAVLGPSRVVRLAMMLAYDEVCASAALNP